ncbi:MAG: hypothetical protein HZA90_21870 [Verrucomicrobia bacterium]|nr:hypothetical protein [Verrucomicrobiota bacterium]
MYDLYTAPTTPTARAAVVKSIRLVNTDTASRTINLFFKKEGGTARLIMPKDLSVAAGCLVVDSEEVSLGSGDKIQGKASAGNKIDYVISGIERDE